MSTERGFFMLTRSPTTESKTLKTALGSSPAGSGMTDTTKLSVISNDLRIIGQGLKIISQGTLQVDGEVEGDVIGNEIVIGEMGQVTGTLAAERVTVRGKVSGAIRSVTVTLQSSARVEGDIHQMSLVIEQGAEFDGRCRRPANAAELKIDLNAESHRT
jgi:cytoskeletal protein CcmA (bactofilin family)